MHARIAVYQGEDDDVRHNDSVGEFLLDGLADVDCGNEILVRFDLDLDGILKVSATERATGRQKQLTIDNAVTRFRAGNRQEALARVKATYLAEPGAAGDRAEAPPATLGLSPALTEEAAGPSVPAADLPAGLAPLIDRCEQLLAKSGKLAGQSNPADAAEMSQLAEQLRAAIASGSQAGMEAAAAKLEDLVFYLQDA